MLQTKTVESGTLSLLKQLLQLPAIQSCCLVGGTALSLLYGHRKSIDLDLFTHEDLDLNAINNLLLETFGSDYVFENNRINWGIFCFIRNVKVDIIKYPHQLLRDPVEIDGIRMYHTDDIVAMKINAILGRGKKKDFWDLAELTKYYTVLDMIKLYREKYPNQMLLISTPQALTYFDDAEESEDPVSLNNQTWQGVKETLRQAVREYLS